ncbi:MAG: phage tail protein [Rhodopila sp.]
MSAAAYRAPRPAPPHDPLCLRLSGHDRWRDSGAGTGLAVPRGSGRLTLAIVSPPGPALLDPLGLLGGLVPPPWVALAPDGALYLLDRTGRRLLWFDACACGFVPLPCLAAPAPLDPRALEMPVAIAAGNSALVLADGHDQGAIVVLARRDLSVRMVRQRNWRPGPVAIDSDGRFYVADMNGGAVHRFTADGRWLGTITGLGVINGMTVDRSGRLYVVSADAVRRFTPAGAAIDQPADVAAIRPAFSKLPFGIDAAGRLVLADLCRAAGATPIGFGLFDTTGAPLAGAPAAWPHAVYTTAGRLVTGPLDSHIAACVWHRIVLLDVDLPAHTGLRIRARTDEIELPIDLIAPAVDSGWSAPQIWRGPMRGHIECLFTNNPGRYLWLEISLQGSGAATPSVAASEIEFPRIPLRRYLPAAFAQDPVTGEFADRFLALFDQAFRSVERQIDNEAALFDPRSTRPDMLTWLASWVGLRFPGGATTAEQRRLLRAVPQLYAKRGTVEGLRQLLVLYLDLNRGACEPRPCRWGPACPPLRPPDVHLPKILLEHWRLRRWLILGRGRLGEASQLWGESILNRSRLDSNAQLGVTQLKLERDPIRDPFHADAHIFSVFLPAGSARKSVARQRIEALIRAESPAHTKAIVHWVEPNMRLGLQSTLGFDSVIGMRPPAPVMLDAAKLGRATVLRREGPPSAGVPLERGTRLAVGTRLG